MADHHCIFNLALGNLVRADISVVAFRAYWWTLICAAMVVCDAYAIANANSIGRQRQMGIKAASANSLTICSGYSCARRPRLHFSGNQLRYVDRTMKNIRTGAQERMAIGQLIGWQERVAQKRFGLPQDNAKATGFDLGAGQMDCIDESTNTISFLQLLEARGLLKFHTIKGYRDRGLIIDGRLPHTTAVITEQSGQNWAVDSWYRAGGEPPVIVPLKTWMKLTDNAY